MTDFNREMFYQMIEELDPAIYNIEHKEKLKLKDLRTGNFLDTFKFHINSNAYIYKGGYEN